MYIVALIVMNSEDLTLFSLTRNFTNENVLHSDSTYKTTFCSGFLRMHARLAFGNCFFFLGKDKSQYIMLHDAFTHLNAKTYT